MKKVVKRLIAQAIAIAMTVQMVGLICPPFNSVKVYAENVSEQNINAEESDVADIAESQDDPTSSVEEEPQFEDMTVSNNLTLNAITEIQNLYISNGTLDLNGNTLVVHGDVIINGRGNLNFNKGELICNNFTMTNTYYGHYMYMQNPNDKLVVNGDFNFTGGYFSSSTENSGVIEVAGDVNITCGFTPSGNHKFILNGLDKQSVYINSSSCKFNILEIANTSDEGVVSNNSINANNITGSLNQLHYTFGGSVGTVIQDDSEINDNYNLAVGDLDLNGNTLIINGDFIQSGGNVILGGGHLIVNGDYLIQTENEDGSFSYSTGTLNMTNESDLVEVSGNFVMGSTKNHSELLTNGTLKIGGNFSQMNYGSDSAYNFKASGDHTTVIKANENGNNISFANASNNYSHFNNLTIEDGSNVTISNTAVVTGVLDGTDCTVNGYVNLAGGASVNGKFCGDLRISEGYTLNSDIMAIGNLYVESTLNLNGKNISIEGNAAINNYLQINGGEFDCKGDLTVSYYYGRIYMTTVNDIIRVSGNFTFDGGYYSSSLTAGKLFISGNCNIYRSAFNAGTNLEIIFDGNEKQIINVTDSGAKLSNINIRNTSDEGIEITKAFNYDKLTNESEAKITFANGGSVGTTQTEKTKTIDGDFVLAMGDLDLNGNTMIINGDFIQSGGNVILGGGHLIVNGDYLIQTENEDGSFSYSTGTLNMTNESDLVEVSGNFVMGSTRNHSELLTNGTLKIGGNFSQMNYGSDSAYNFKTSGDHTTVIKANENGNNISFANASNNYSHFNNLTIEDGSNVTISNTAVVTGVLDGTDCTVNGYVNLAGGASVNGKFCGDLRISEGYTLNSDIMAMGNLYVETTLNLNGKNISIEGNAAINNYLQINGGEFDCKGDLTVSYYYGHIYMTTVNDIIRVSGNFTFDGGYYSSSLTAGKLFISGNCNIYRSTFKTGSNYEIILNGSEKQIINVTDSGAKLSSITIINTSDEGIEITKAFNYDKLTNESEAKITFANGGSVGTTQTEKTKTIDGDFVLAMGDLDLNGNTMIINGDFIQSGGNVILGGGHLIVNGDYLIQTENEDGSFSYSTGTLNMTNESDLVEVSGNFVMGSTKNHSELLTNGTLKIGGNFSQMNYGSDSAYNFKASGDHTTVIKANENGNNISFANASNNYSHFNNLTIEDGSNVTISNTAVVTGVLDGTDCTVNGYVNLAGGASVNGKFCGDLRISEKYTLNSNVNASGDLYIGSDLYLGTYEFNVVGNVTQNYNLYVNTGKLNCNGNYNVNSYLNLGSGKLICGGNLNVSYRYGHISMQNASSEIHVGGDFTFDGGYYSSSFTAGKLVISGNCNVSGSTFKTGSNYEIILNGSEKQILNVTNSNAKLSSITIRNTSDEGIEITKAFNYDKLTNESEAKITFANGGSVGTTQTEKTKTIDGDFVLAMGDLDLNGNTLTINGDFIQSGGNVILGGGHLIVNGDYLIQTENEDGSFSYSTGKLNMTNESDLVEVSGNFVMGSTKNHSELLTNGTLKIGGNFSQMNYGSDSAYNFKASGDHTTIIDGKSKQSIKFDNPTYSSFLNISFENAAEISLDTNVYAYGKVKDEYTSVNGSYLYITKLSQIEGDCFGGNIYLTANNNADSHITKDLTIGNLSCDYLYLDEYKVSVNSLTVNSLLDIGKGYLETRNNLYISQYAYFKMNEPEAKVLVAGNLTFNSRYSSSNTLTNGTLEIKGDFIHNRNSEFICSGDHLTILSGKSASNGRSYIQTIAVYKNGYKFNKLIVTRPESLFNVKYYSTGTKTNFADICNEFSFEYDDIEPPSKVSGLTASETTADSIHLVWNSSDDNVRVTGYEIYRNGEKLITTGRTEYIDQSLSPNTSYSYQVYAFDEERNYSEGSEVLKTSTLEDTEAPDMPQNLKFSAVTGSSLTLSWNSSKDNVATAGYIIYRNNEEIARVKDCVFKDADLGRNIEYSYMIKAYDEAGNTSDFSDIITGSVVMPKITSLSPSDGSSLGGKTQIITVIFEKTGDGRGNNVTIGCKKAGENEYTLLTEEPLYAESYSANKLCIKYTWNTAGLDGNFDICATLYDADGNTDVKEASYNVTSAGPKAPQELNAVTNNGTVELTWKKSVSADCVKYIIYRLDPNSEEYKEVAVINDRNTVRYIDKTVLAGEKYTYKISGVNSFDIEGEASNTAQIIVAEDKASPEIKAITADKSRLNKTAEIKVSAEDNLVVKSVKLEYKKADDEEYTLIGETDCKNGVAIFNWDTVNIADGTYMLRATAFDANGNISVVTDDSEREFTVDNTGISKITIDVENCTTASTHVSLRWNDVTEPDFGYFAVEQKQSDGSFKEVGKSTNVTGLHVQNLKPNTEYTFIVVGYDNIGNRGEASDKLTIRTNSDTVSPVITAFYPESKAYNSVIDIKITAKDNAEVSSVKLAYSYDSGDEKTWYPLTEVSENTNGTFGYSFDISEMEEGKIYIQATACDNAGNISDSVVGEFIVDRTQPDEITDLVSETGNGNVHLVWTVTSDDTEKFLIYKSEGELNSYSLIAECSTKDYYDITAKLGTLYSYKVIAVDTAGNKSEYSNEAIAQITEDNIVPRLLGFNYKSGTSVSTTPKMSVVAWDNFALSSATVEYKPKDASNGIWYEIGTFDLSSNYAAADFTWNTDGLDDGIYEFRAYCSDMMGNISNTFTAEFTLDATSPDAPVLELLQKDFLIELEWSEPEADDIDCYKVYRKDSKNKNFELLTQTTTPAYSDTDVEPYKTYTYMVEVYDKVGNFTASNEMNGYAFDNDTVAPIIDIPDELYGIAGEEILIDGSACSDNVRIKRFIWDMGDGNTIYGMKNVYTYDDPGEYTVTLTVEDSAGNKAEKDIAVTVYEPSEYGFINIEVTDSNNNPLSYSYIYVYLGDSEGVHTMRTGYDGTLKLCVPIGDNKIAAYKDGYLPEEKEIAINNEGDNGTAKLALQSGELVTGNLEVHRMSLEEMAEAGIDFNDPQNYHTVKFSVKLTFAQEPIPTIIEYIYTGNGSYISGGGAGGIGGTWSGGTYSTSSGGNISFSPVVRQDAPEEEQPILAYVYVNQSISFMKEMYAVNLGVLNNADKQFVIENSSATLNLPYGLSLAAPNQTLTQSMGSIAGQQQKTIGWSVRGDRKGEYDLSADFKGTLMPFGAPVSASFKTATPFTVGAGDGIVIHVMPESCAYIGEQYYVQLAVVNEGSDTFYNLTTDFGAYTNPGQKSDITVTYPDGTVETHSEESACYEIESADECEYIPVISGGQQVRVKIFKPGDVIYGTYSQVFSAEGDPEKVYYKLIDSVVEQLSGNTNVKVVVSPIPSHITKMNVQLKIVENTWADPVDMTTGAYTDQIAAMSVNGEFPLNLNLNYNSLNVPESRERNENDLFWYSQKGQLGYGWSHDFEAYLDVNDSVINVHLNPSSYASFIDEQSAIKNVNGEIIDGRVVLHKPNDTGVKNYVCISSGMSDYFMSRDENNIYTLEMPNGQKYMFDSNGKLIKLIQSNGKSTTLTHIGNTTTVTEDNTGAKLVLNYSDDGLLTSIGDGNGRITTLTYENDLLTSVTNPLSEKVVYTYDKNDRLITAAIDGCDPYVTNTYDDEGRVIAQGDADSNTPLSYFSYSESENNEFIVDGTDRNGNTVKYVSDGMGHLLSVTDQNGNTVKYSYDLKGNLLDETTADGYTTVYSYDNDNNLVKVKDSSGNETKFTYDNRGNILSVTGPNGEKNVYMYNSSNLLLTQTEYTSARKSFTYNENAQILTEAIEGLGVRKYEYTSGRITAVSDYEGNISYKTYDEYGNLHSETDREGHQKVYSYDLLNRLVSVTDEDGTESYTYDVMGNKTSVTDSRGNTVYYAYNSNNWLISMTDAKGTISYAYDNEGRLIRQTNTDGTVVVNIYDAVGNVISTTNENGEVTKFTYDTANRMISKTIVNGDNEYTESYEYYPNGKVMKTTFADGTSESYEYDKQWRLIKTTDANGNSFASEYDASNNLLKTEDAESNSTSYTYDKYGRMTRSTDANGNVTTYDEYDLNGLCTQKTLPNGQIVKIGYNKEGMVTKATFVSEDENSEDISVCYEYDAMGRVTKYTNEEGYSAFTEYDENGNIIKLTDSEGNIVTSQYDEVNSLILSTNAIGVDTQYTYDSVGNLVKTLESLNTTREEKTENVYDNLGRIIKSIDAENGTSEYEYNQLGEVSAQVDPNGGRTEYSYDSMGRVTETVNPIGGSKTYTYDDVGKLASQKNARSQETTYEYYKNGWIKSFTDELGTVSYTYDGNGNVLTVTDENGTITRKYDCMNHVTKYTDFRGNTIDYSYDQLGNLVALTYPGGRIVHYTYYKTGQVKTVTDWDNRTTSFEYDGNGRLVKTTRPEGSIEERTYDANGRLVTIVDKNGENVVNQTVYSYDESNNVTSVTMSENTSINGLASAEMKYNAANQLIEYNGEEVKYDTDGNMIYGPLDGKMTEFKYDCRNRLVSAGGISYEYDAENNRISQTENDVRTSYVVDSNSSTLTRILVMTKGDDTTYFIYGIGLLAQESNDDYLTYHFNNIGSTVAVTNIDGEIAEKFEYGPYGELLSENACGIIFLYNGEVGVATDSNGLYYMRARYYNPEIKRFVNQDVVIGSITDSPTLNRYAYVNGNPISLNDPFGLSPLLNWFSGITGHDILGLFGMLPGVGFVFDGINAAWYVSEGDYFNATCSFVSALPGVGDAFGAFSKAGKSCKLVTTFHKAGAAGDLMIGSYTFGIIADKYMFGDGNYTEEEIKQDLFTVALTGTSMWGSAKDFGTSYCFVAGTLVTTEDGFKPIEEIEVGDKVLSENEMTGEVAVKTVTETYVNETDELVHIGVNGETISATPSHPFYVDKLGWTLARSLRAGDVLVLSNGELVVVEWVQHEILESPIKVYNFEVEDFHTYFVGESSVLVHNMCELDDDALVVRGGQSSPDNLKTNQSKDPRGHISANSANGVSLDDLATTPQPFKNGKVTVTTVGEIRKKGMDVLPDPSGSNPYHASIVPSSNPMTDEEAEILSSLFKAIDNSWR